jgi:hypothetical protein
MLLCTGCGNLTGRFPKTLHKKQRTYYRCLDCSLRKDPLVRRLRKAQESGTMFAEDVGLAYLVTAIGQRLQQARDNLGPPL